MSDLSELTAAEMRQGLDSKKFTSVELAEACLTKAERLAHLNCFTVLTKDSALAQAQRADDIIQSGRSAPLLGIPVAIKDIICTKGINTTAASNILRNFVPPYDATVVKKLTNSGAVSIGKLNLDEFAMGSSNENSIFGPVKNPWDTTLVPGGSSGGSAAAVAARICPITLGTDTGGSIRQPAAFCGITGLKPTYGRVSRFGVIAYASSLDQVGGFARSVKDCAEITQILCGKDPNDATSSDKETPNLNAALSRGVKGVRIGVPKEYFVAGLDPQVESSIRNALAHLEKQGATLVEISLPHTDVAVSVYYIIAPAEASSNLARYDGIRYGHRAAGKLDLTELYSKSRSEGFGKEVQRRILVGTYVLSSGYFDAYYVKAQKARALITKDFTDAFAQKCDVIIGPTTPTPPFTIGAKGGDPVEMYLNDIFTIPVNLAGLPAMSIPSGFTNSGLPIGMQIIGKHWDEETVFQVAAAYESLTDWNSRRPAGI